MFKNTFREILPDLTKCVDPGRLTRTHQWEHEPRKGICPFAARICTGDRMAHNNGRLRFTNHDSLLRHLYRERTFFLNFQL